MFNVQQQQHHMYRKGSYRRRTPAVKRKSYQKNVTVIGGSGDLSTVPLNLLIIQNTTNQSKLQVARPQITLNVFSTTATLMYWALVYVPDGYTANSLTLTSGGDLYEPAQNIIESGSFITDSDATVYRITSRLKRNLNEGDSIRLLMRGSATGTTQYAGTATYYTSSN